MGSVAIEFKNVKKKFGRDNNYAVDDVSLEIEEGELITILGSSGCGKTTLLKLVNRLYEPDEGEIILFGENIKDVDKVLVRRRIGYVIQQIGLFPHMTIGENIQTVPRLLGWSKNDMNSKTDEMLELIGLLPSEYKDRYPGQLSGGQQQRVGRARALAADPKIMLLDEPFGAIDAITRSNLQDQLLKIHGGLRKTFLFVTHDINEAFKLGNRVIVMNQGKVCQFDTPKNIALNPKDAFVKELIASSREQEAFWEGLS